MSEQKWEIQQIGDELCILWGADCVAVVTHGHRLLAQRIIRSVNAHDKLVAALDGLMWRFEGDDSDPNSPDDIAPDVLLARQALSAAGQEVRRE